MEISGNALKKLGKKFRDNYYDEADIKLLENYRNTHDELLVNKSLELDQSLRNQSISYLISGRSKRINSIIRKLQRPQNHGMDLSRVSDLVGIRIIVEDLPALDKILQIITNTICAETIYDYVKKPARSGYRSIHIIVKDGVKLVEIQLRTLYQHLWSTESESFGEKVKEGSSNGPAREYLDSLAQACHKLDNNENVDEKDYSTTPYMLARNPITGIHPYRKNLFLKVSAGIINSLADVTYIIIFDKNTGESTQQFEFKGSQRQAALETYSRYNDSLDTNKYDLLIINSPSREGIQVTHPKFF